MPKKPAPVQTEFKCKEPNVVTVVGENFSAKVTVKLESTKHQWTPEEVPAQSGKGGTEVTVRSTPTRKDKTECPKKGSGYPMGDLTITVTNDNGTEQTSDTAWVNYYSP